jgi:hypothetical protein
MPELILCAATSTTLSSLLDSVDAVIDAYSAPSLETLKIDVSEVDQCDVVVLPANRVSPWLRFASQRLADRLYLGLPLQDGARRFARMRFDADLGRLVDDGVEELALPLCSRATTIELDLESNFILRPPPTGSFTALTELTIGGTQMDGGELRRVVSSTQCPRLRKLNVFCVELVAVYDVTICSGSLECLRYGASETCKLEVTAPM